MPENGGSRAGARWQLLVAVLGASAGLTFLLYLVGLIVLTRRFGTLLLPGAETIAPLSRDPALAAGGRALAAPILGAIGSAVIFSALVVGSWRWPRRQRRVVLVVLGVVALLALIPIGALQWGKWEYALFAALLAVAAVVAWWVLCRLVKGWTNERGERRPVPKWRGKAVGVAGVTAFVVALIAGSVVAVHLWRPPVDLEYAEVALRPGGTVNGIFLALTENELFIAPAVRCSDGYVTHQRVLVVPRGDIKRITMHRKAHVWDGGRLRTGETEGGCDH